MEACTQLESLTSEKDRQVIEELQKAVGTNVTADCSTLRVKLSQGLKSCGYSISKASLPGDITSNSNSNRLNGTAANTGKNGAALTSGFQLSGWKSHKIPEQLPKLPEVLDATLLKAAFIHQGAGNATDLNYERLEWVGDSYMELAATLLISQTFPAYLPGKASQLRERLVKNSQLAEYARKYEFEKRAILPQEFTGIPNSKHHGKDTSMTKVLGDLFEAYIGAVVLSDPANGLPRAMQWLKNLWGMTIRRDIVDNERQGNNYDSPLWRLRGDQVDLKGPQQQNSKDELRKSLHAPGIKLEYLDAAPEKKGKDKLPIFTVGVYLTGLGENRKLLAIGTGKGKKDAGFKAAGEVLKNRPMMKMYTDKKKVLEELAAREEAARADAGFPAVPPLEN
ncbi:ribonuclease III domain-containing protein [Calycina marina]|uniref:Ribonuclease III domain-containing protein n=1 Tax=Calycina marina TaxID=1763456 RepID=A0A9P8CDT4_9HELO|nr:ribonuclease III domain-containing protein [Calycina marina]